MIDDESVSSTSEIARKDELIRSRVAQIMNHLKLQADLQEFLLKLDDPKDIRKFSERNLRKGTLLTNYTKLITATPL
jgi:hypothetical protein